MGWAKRQFVTKAFGKIGLAGYVFDLTAEQLQDVLEQLDAMMASWNVVGIRIGYPLPSNPSASDLDQQTSVPDYANRAIYLNLGVEIGPDFGKVISPELKQSAKNAYNALLQQASGMPPEMQLPGSMPAGAGNKSWYRPFLTAPVDPLLSGSDGEIEFE